MTACPVATQFPGYGCIDDHTSNWSFDLQSTWAINELSLVFPCFPCLFVESGRLVQELNVCTKLSCNQTILTRAFFYLAVPLLRSFSLTRLSPVLWRWCITDPWSTLHSLATGGAADTVIAPPSPSSVD